MGSENSWENGLITDTKLNNSYVKCIINNHTVRKEEELYYLYKQKKKNPGRNCNFPLTSVILSCFMLCCSPRNWPTIQRPLNVYRSTNYASFPILGHSTKPSDEIKHKSRHFMQNGGVGDSHNENVQAAKCDEHNWHKNSLNLALNSRPVTRVYSWSNS